MQEGDEQPSEEELEGEEVKSTDLGRSPEPARNCARLLPNEGLRHLEPSLGVIGALLFHLLLLFLLHEIENKQLPAKEMKNESDRARKPKRLSR